MDSNFIPRNSKNSYISIRNSTAASETTSKMSQKHEKMRSPDFGIFLNFSIESFKTLTRFCGHKFYFIWILTSRWMERILPFLPKFFSIGEHRDTLAMKSIDLNLYPLHFLNIQRHLLIKKYKIYVWGTKFQKPMFDLFFYLSEMRSLSDEICSDSTDR